MTSIFCVTHGYENWKIRHVLCGWIMALFISYDFPVVFKHTQLIDKQSSERHKNFRAIREEFFLKRIFCSCWVVFHVTLITLAGRQILMTIKLFCLEFLTQFLTTSVTLIKFSIFLDILIGFSSLKSQLFFTKFIRNSLS